MLLRNENASDCDSSFIFIIFHSIESTDDISSEIVKVMTEVKAFNEEAEDECQH